ncbi:CBS domain-containing protein [Kyrpidia tusciae]|uniref:Signal transduction protein with CBS domains n=1 Tax=Kyrpidia tusciae (strain DSM 2912 / NBRC 15312 / T2) TaxID=562970 RepID=D5WSL2_KYRT2|nr:CBS domain-containing protein [Kyrpidia tusciae]ADG07031.1 putative signal transduction protein with CBS domains [Kyrpidia tusciae DSM 2912]MBE3551706.1 CBS domain-containing protein [Kyrpidia tusciae]
MKLKDLMTTQVSYVSPASTCKDAARVMNDINVGSVPVVDKDKLVGICTDRDIVLKCIAAGKDPATTAVKDCMTANPITGTPDMDAHQASDLMSQHQIRRLPVVDQGKLVGMVAIGDLAVTAIHQDEAGEALSGISQGVH